MWALLVGVGGLLATLLAGVSPAGAQTPTCKGLPATIVGTSGDDRIIGTPRQDVIVALEGRDVIFGREGNDIICGGPGADSIKGGAGKDQLEGGGGNDRLVGGIGKDTIFGGPGKDRIFAGGGGDILDGGKNSDLVIGQNGNDDCDLDSSDRFSTCETGDVVGINGTGEGSYPISIPNSFISYNLGTGGGPQLQGLTPVVVFSYSAIRDGAGTTTFTFLDAQGSVLNAIGSLNTTYGGVTAVWGMPATIMVEADANPIAFDIAAVDASLIPELGSSIAGTTNTVYRPGFPTDGPLTLNFTIGNDVSGSVAVFFYDAAGNLTAPVFVQTLGPQDPRQFTVPFQTPVRLIEVFAVGSWTLTFT